MYTTEIKPKNKWYDIDFKAIWQYRDLIMLFVRRDFVSVYKQTVLGPIWFFVQPMLTTATFTLIFSVVAKISTNDIPPPLFYIIGLTFWGYFASCLTATSATFTSNAGVFGKVYFPRLIMPISVVISSLIKLSIQFLLLLIVWFYYFLITDILHPNITLVLMPFYVLIFAGLGLGLGIILSSLTTKYRDFTFLIGFGVQLLMYATPVIYPLSLLDDQNSIIKSVVKLNPISGVIEAIRYGLTGSGIFDIGLLAYSFGFVIVVLIIGVITFSKVEKSFIDTV